uniref:ribonuclease J n=2 Tax=Corynebacterium TaxID=1716 RepID=UPI0026F2F4C6
MNESRNRPRKVTRKAGPPAEAQETASNEAASPVFQAPDNSATNSAVQKNENSGNSEKSSENKNQGENTNRRNRSRGSRGRGRGGNNGQNNQGDGNQGGRNNRRGGNNNNRRNVPKSMQGADLTKRLPQPPKQAKGSLRIYALGGISEIGRNMTVFEYDGKLLVIDCGVLFPSSGEPGVDLILPDFGPIENKLDKIEALIITHAHEDHIGAIPWLLKLRSDIPIVASRFTIALIAAKCKEHRQRPKFIEVNEKSDVSYGPFRARFWAVNHSVPDALGVMLGTPAGNVIHTGDIKLDQTPLDGRPTDLPALSRYGDEGVDLMLCDSTNANIPGVSASEGDIPATFNRLVARARQRVIIASFASNVYRVQAAIDAAVNAGRKVAFNGRSMMRNME